MKHLTTIFGILVTIVSVHHVGSNVVPAKPEVQLMFERLVNKTRQVQDNVHIAFGKFDGALNSTEHFLAENLEKLAEAVRSISNHLIIYENVIIKRNVTAIAKLGYRLSDKIVHWKSSSTRRIRNFEVSMRNSLIKFDEFVDKIVEKLSQRVQNFRTKHPKVDSPGCSESLRSIETYTETMLVNIFNCVTIYTVGSQVNLKHIKTSMIHELTALTVAIKETVQCSQDQSEDSNSVVKFVGCVATDGAKKISKILKALLLLPFVNRIFDKTESTQGEGITGCILNDFDLDMKFFKMIMVSVQCGAAIANPSENK